MKYFPLAYRWFLVKGLTDWEPWYFVDTVETVKAEPRFLENQNFARAFKVETGADFNVYLFARRQDMDDFAFFIVHNGKIEDKVVHIHLSFANRLELRNPLRYTDSHFTFIQWLRKEVISDVADWMTEEDLYD